MIDYENIPIWDDLIKILVEKQLTVSSAESCTGGLVGATFTSIPGSSAYYEGGIISYSNDVKTSILKVSKDALSIWGAVSEEVARQMVEGVKAVTGTSCAIATTGIAGPGGGSDKKPIGLVYIGVSIPNRTKVFKHIFKGTRDEVRKQTVLSAVTYLLYMLQE